MATTEHATLSKRTATILIAAWCVAFVIALLIDASVARWVHDSGTAKAVAGSTLATWVKAPGTFWFTAAVIGLLWIARRIDWRKALYVVATAAFAGLNVIPKWIVGRTRPFKLPIPIADQPRPLELHPFWHGLNGLFHEVNLSFPSGHECTAFALAAAAWVAYRPAAWPLFVLAFAVGVERVVENAHYGSDVVGAVAFATAGAALVRFVGRQWSDRFEPEQNPVAPTDPARL